MNNIYEKGPRFTAESVTTVAVLVTIVVMAATTFLEPDQPGAVHTAAATLVVATP